MCIRDRGKGSAEGGDPHDDETGRCRGVRRLAEEVDQRGHGEDRPTAAEGAEGESDQQAQPDREDKGHWPGPLRSRFRVGRRGQPTACLLYTSDAADDLTRVDLGGRRIIKKKKKK